MKGSTVIHCAVQSCLLRTHTTGMSNILYMKNTLHITLSDRAKSCCIAVIVTYIVLVLRSVVYLKYTSSEDMQCQSEMDENFVNKPSVSLYSNKITKCLKKPRTPFHIYHI